MNHVLLTNLKPATRYFYQVGSDTAGWSETLSFLTAQPAGQAEETRFLGWGDMGAFPDNPMALLVTREALADAEGKGFDHFVLHFGDVSYARGHGHIWDWWHNQLTPLVYRGREGGR